MKESPRDLLCAVEVPIEEGIIILDHCCKGISNRQAHRAILGGEHLDEPRVCEAAGDGRAAGPC